MERIWIRERLLYKHASRKLVEQASLHYGTALTVKQTQELVLTSLIYCSGRLCGKPPAFISDEQFEYYYGARKTRYFVEVGRQLFEIFPDRKGRLFTVYGRETPLTPTLNLVDFVNFMGEGLEMTKFGWVERL